MELGKIIKHDIYISPSSNMGFIVKIGCADFVATNSNDLLGDLKEYLAEPDKWEKEFDKKCAGSVVRRDDAREVPSHLNNVVEQEQPACEDRDSR